MIISLVTTSGNIDFDFTEKSQYFIGKHIRKFINRSILNMRFINRSVVGQAQSVLHRRCNRHPVFTNFIRELNGE